MPHRWVLFPPRYVEPPRPHILPVLQQAESATITTSLTPSTVFQDPAVGRSTSTGPSVQTTFAEQYTFGKAISSTLSPSTSLGESANHPRGISTSPSPLTRLGTNQGRAEGIGTSISLVTIMQATRQETLRTGPFPSNTLSSSATHPGITTSTILAPVTQMSATQPRAIQTVTIGPTTLLAGFGSRFKGILSSLNPSTVLAKFAARISALSSSLTPQTTMLLVRVHLIPISTSLTPQTVMAEFANRFRGIQTLLQWPPNVNYPIITFLSTILGRTDGISTGPSPSTVLQGNKSHALTITTSLTPQTTLAESATHGYNPVRTMVQPITFMGQPTVQYTKAITTILSPLTTLTGPGAHPRPIQTAPTVQTSLAMSAVMHFKPLLTHPLPSTVMAVQVSRQAVIRTQPQAWTYFIPRGLITYTRTIPMKGDMGGPLLQWMLCGPRVAAKGPPRVVSCFGNVVGVA